MSAACRHFILLPAVNRDDEWRSGTAIMHHPCCCAPTQEIDGTLAGFDDDVVYDTPFMLIPGRSRVRAVAKLFSPFATESFEPHVSTNTTWAWACCRCPGCCSIGGCGDGGVARCTSH